jgi:hypothetical protein
MNVRPCSPPWRREMGFGLHITHPPRTSFIARPLGDGLLSVIKPNLPIGV